MRFFGNNPPEVCGDFPHTQCVILHRPEFLARDTPLCRMQNIGVRSRMRCGKSTIKRCGSTILTPNFSLLFPGCEKEKSTNYIPAKALHSSIRSRHRNASTATASSTRIMFFGCSDSTDSKIADSFGKSVKPIVSQ